MEPRGPVADEGARVRMRHGADHVGGPPGGPAPLDPPVLRTAAREHGGLRLVLGRPPGRAGEDRGVRVEQKIHAHLDHARVEGRRRVLRVDVEGLLGDDVAGISLRGHVMQRDTRARLAVHQHPVDRSAPPVLRE